MVKLTGTDGSVLECSVEEYAQLAKAAGLETPTLGEYENEIEVDGVIYEKVDDDAKEGDYIVYDEAPYSFITAGKPYLVIHVDKYGNATVEDDDGDLSTADDEFDVYRKKETTSNAEVLTDESTEIGDKFVVLNSDTNNFHVGEVVTLIEKDAIQTYPGFKRDSDGLQQVVSYENVRRATQEEIETKTPSEREQSFLKFGRKVDEFKEGDIVEVLVSNANYSGWEKGEYARYIGNRGDNLHGRLTDNDACCVSPRYLKLVAPVERLN